MVEKIPYAWCLHCKTSWFDIFSSLSCCLWSQWIWTLPLRWLFLLRVIPVNPRFSTSNGGGDEGGVMFGLFLQLRGDGILVFLLPIVSGLNTAAVCCILTLCDNRCWHVSHECLTVSQGSRIVHLWCSGKVSCTFATFLGVVPVKSHPDASCCLPTSDLFWDA
jgi:hypothetical protein